MQDSILYSSCFQTWTTSMPSTLLVNIFSLITVALVIWVINITSTDTFPFVCSVCGFQRRDTYFEAKYFFFILCILFFLMCYICIIKLGFYAPRKGNRWNLSLFCSFKGVHKSVMLTKSCTCRERSWMARIHPPWNFPRKGATEFYGAPVLLHQIMVHQVANPHQLPCLASADQLFM